MLYNSSENPSKLIWKKLIHTGYLSMPDQPNHFDWLKRLKKIDAGSALSTLSCVVLLSNLADCLDVTQWLWGSGTLQSKRCLLWECSFLNCSFQEKIKVLDSCFGTSKKKRVYQFRLKDARVRCLCIIELEGCGAREANAVTQFQISTVVYL